MLLTPAYGRDYTSGKAVLKDFLEGKDFVFHDITSEFDGKYCSIRDFPSGATITLRYNNLKRVMTYKIARSDK